MPNRTRYRTITATLAAATLVGGTLAGCSAGAADDPNTVNWWGWAPGTEVADEYIAAFNEDHPDIEVNYRSIPFGDYVNALRLGVQSDSGPDVFNLQPGEITNRFARFGTDLTPRLQEALGDDWQGEFVGDSADQFAVDGRQLGMPVQLAASGFLWVNETALETAGVTEAPTNWDELLQSCETLRAAGESCMMIGAQDAWLNTDVFISIANDVAPGAFYDAVEGDGSWTDDGLVEAFAKWQELFTAQVVQEGATGQTTYPDVQTAFTLGEGAFIPLGTWSAGEMMTEAGLTTAQQGAELNRQIILPAPFPDVNGDGKTPGGFGGPDYGLSISTRSGAQDAAWTFVQWLTAEQNGQQMIADRKFVPSLASVSIDDSGLVDPELQSPAIAEMTEILDGIVGPREIPYGDLKVALGDALSSLAVGQQDPDGAAESVEQVSSGLDRTTAQ